MSLLFSKNVFVFFDGTGNTQQSRTNIYKMYEAIPGVEEVNPFAAYNIQTAVKTNGEDKAIYVAGLGTNDPDLNSVQKMTGFGIERNVLMGYEFLVENLTQDDKLYVYGFSRGATTARLLTHYLNEYGIDADNLLDYRLENTLLDLSPSTLGWVPIVELLGLFDSVIGIDTVPGTMGSVLGNTVGLKKRNFLEDAWDTTKETVTGAFENAKDFYKDVTTGYRSKDLVKYTDEVTPNVLNCAHAVAINEYREMFNYSPIGELRMGYEEKFFIGSHSDIGGYVDNERALLSLKWIADKTGLDVFSTVFSSSFDPAAIALYPIYDSYRRPTLDIEVDTWYEKAVRDVYQRDLVGLSTDSADSSSIAFATHLGVDVTQCLPRDAVKDYLRDDLYDEGHYSI